MEKKRMENNITVTAEFLTTLKADFKKAIEEKKGEFKSGGYDFVTDYAKYLIEYCEGEFNKQKPKEK